MLRLLVCFLCLPLFAFAKPRQVVGRPVPDNFRALAPDKQRLTGILGSRIRANSEGFLENIDLEELIRPLQGQTQAAGSVERNFAGQFLEASADAFEYNHNPQLRDRMDSVVAELAAFAKRSTASTNTRLDEAGLANARFDMLGLLAYARATGQSGGYVTAQGIASSTLKLLSSQMKQETSTQQSWTLAEAGLIEPFVQLYRRSGNRKYLDFCLSLARAVAVPDIAITTPQATLVRTFSAFNGFAELYEVTADPTFLQPAIAGWNHVQMIGRLSVTGAPLPPATEAAVIDACTSSSWLQLTFKLLRITGEPIYGDQLERTTFNQLLAGQEARNGNISPEVPLNGSKFFSQNLRGARGSCMLSEAKALATIPEFVWGRYEKGIAINLYTPGRASFALAKQGLIQIYSEGSFPQTGQLQLHVEPSKKSARFALRLRVPNWTDDFNIELADLRLKGRRGEAVVIDREWKSGDTVRVSMAIPLITSHAISSHAADSGGQTLVLQRGPQVLALGTPLNPDIQDLNSTTLIPLSSGHFQISEYIGKLPRHFGGDQIYSIEGQVLGKGQELLLIPFADATTYLTTLRTEPGSTPAK